MKYLGLILIGSLLAGCGELASETLPTGVSDADVAIFKSAVTDAGCAIQTREQANGVATATGFDRDKLRSITQYLVIAGESQALGDAGFRLTSGSCANA